VFFASKLIFCDTSFTINVITKQISNLLRIVYTYFIKAFFTTLFKGLRLKLHCE